MSRRRKPNRAQMPWARSTTDAPIQGWAGFTSHTIGGGSRYDAASGPKRAADNTQKAKVEAVGATVRPDTGLGMMAAIAPTTSM